MKKVLFIFGTRPEAVKLAPLIKEFLQHPDEFDTKICVTAQHREMLDQVLTFFNIVPDYDLNIMEKTQNLHTISMKLLDNLKPILSKYKPQLIIVQGDTTTTLISALAGYYEKIRIAHIEAGLRSGNIYSPFPEEGNRKLTGQLADYHFAPTETARRHLLTEGITENVWVVGNTIVDAMMLCNKIIAAHATHDYYSFFKDVNFSKKIILVTSHRRESFGKPVQNICKAIGKISLKFPDIEIVIPLHLNPNIQTPYNELLNSIKNVHIIEPLPYPHFIWLMSKSYLILTDSGGVQEEAPSFGIPVLVLRKVTERVEGIDSGCAVLLGTEEKKIVDTVTNLLNNKSEYLKMTNISNPYGDGTSSKKIYSRLSMELT